MLGSAWANVYTFRQFATKFWCLDILGQMWICFDRAQSSFDVSTVSNKCGVVSTSLEHFWFFDCLKQIRVNLVRARLMLNVSIVSSEYYYVLNFFGKIVLFRTSRATVDFSRPCSTNCFCLDRSDQFWTTFDRAWPKFDAWTVLSKCGYVSTARDQILMFR